MSSSAATLATSSITSTGRRRRRALGGPRAQRRRQDDHPAAGGDADAPDIGCVSILDERSVAPTCSICGRASGSRRRRWHAGCRRRRRCSTSS
jgi:hypothetical protein